jgi:hypothetical protein
LLGPFRIEPDESHVMRYRFVVSDGPPEARRIEAFWNGFARPAAPSVDFDN